MKKLVDVLALERELENRLDVLNADDVFLQSDKAQSKINTLIERLQALYVIKKSESKGYLLRIQAMGSAIEIVSPIPRDQFVEEMVETITTQGANPEWSGWYHLKKTDDKIVSIRLRSIDVVEEL